MDDDQVNGAAPLNEMDLATEIPKTKEEEIAEKAAESEARSLANFANSDGWKKLREIIARDVLAIERYEMVDATASDQIIASDFKANSKLAELLKNYIKKVDLWADDPDDETKTFAEAKK